MAGNEKREIFQELINEICLSYNRLKTPHSLSQEALEEVKSNHMKKYQKALSLVPGLPNSEIALKLLSEYKI
jgi:hypothetical protein